MSTREFFDTLETRLDPSKTAGMNNSYLFRLDEVAEWEVDVQDLGGRETEGVEDADVASPTSEETFDKIVKREQNATSAYMTGKLKVKGDMGAAMKLQKLF